jgi:hypothetical protein
MEFTPLADPFTIQFKKDAIEYKARVVYAKAVSSCTNVFNVEVITPQGIEPFRLREKPVHSEEEDIMLWIDSEGRDSIFYQLIGEQIAEYLKHQLGIFLLDMPVTDRNHESTN